MYLTIKAKEQNFNVTYHFDVDSQRTPLNISRQQALKQGHGELQVYDTHRKFPHGDSWLETQV